MLNGISLLITLITSTAFCLFLIICAFAPINASVFLTAISSTEREERNERKEKKQKYPKPKSRHIDDDIIFDDEEL